MLQSAGKALLLAFALSFTTNSVISCFAQNSETPRPIALAKADKQDKVSDWFQKYDNVRHQAQMSPQEKERSTALMTQGMAASIFKSAQGEQDKAAASALLKRMVDRYRRASAQLTELPEINETRKLHRGYQQYFRTAGDLFADYLKVQNNLFAQDANGNSLVAQLQQRKGDLEALDVANKDLDAKLRAKYKIPAYPW